MRADERARLGASEVEVTRLGFGAAPLGNLFEALDEEVARETVERTWELGVRHFDTAPLYGYGIAEERLGRVLPAKPRDELVLATKVGRLLSADAPADPSLAHLFTDHPPLNAVFDFSRDAVLRSMEESLARLRLECIDVVHIHDPYDHCGEALEITYPALEELRSQGAIGAIGVGIAHAGILARFARETDVDCFLLPGRYSLLVHDELAELLALCAARDVSLIVGGVYNSGILANPADDARFEYQQAPPETIERARALQAVCARHDVPLAAAAIQYPLGSPVVAGIIVGGRSAAEMEENARMFELPIPTDLWAELRAEGLLPADVPVPAPAP